MAPKCYILGAGASFGYNTDLPWIQRPPLTTEFFIKGTALGILTEERFPKLVQGIHQYIEAELPDADIELSDWEQDIEAVLDWLVVRFENTDPTDDPDAAAEAQQSLSEAFYFVFELLRYYTSNYRPRADAYRRLALHYHQEPYSVITLNYDTLFEIALSSLGLDSHYFPGGPPLGSVGVAKLHGSINMMNRAFGGGDTFSERIQHVYSNVFALDNVSLVPAGTLSQITYRDLAKPREGVIEPAIVPPVAVKEEVNKVSVYDPMWYHATQMLYLASEIVVVGCSLREGDRKFIELLESAMGGLTKVTVAQPHPDPVHTTIEGLVDDTSYDTESCSDFEEYAMTL
jgi:hypothetical protein